MKNPNKNIEEKQFKLRRNYNKSPKDGSQQYQKGYDIKMIYS